MMTRPPATNIPANARFVGGAVGFVFAAIGLTVIGFLWFGFDRNEFGAPPLFFRIFGSLIATMFVILGGSAALAAVTGNPRFAPGPVPTNPAASEPLPGRPLATGPYACPHCGAALSGNADVSPHGDVKCAHCGAWFNIHGRT